MGWPEGFGRYRNEKNILSMLAISKAQIHQSELAMDKGFCMDRGIDK